MSNINY